MAEDPEATVTAALPAVSLPTSSIAPFRGLMSADEWNEFTRTMADCARLAKSRAVWNVNSTASGGGVAEMLIWQIPYERAAGIDSRWVVLRGSTAFFTFTKRLHTLLHGVAADGSTISAAERSEYEQTLARNAQALIGQVRPEDVVILHDPQTAGLIRPLVDHGCQVIWRSHIGVDEPNDVTRRAWAFLLPEVRAAHAAVFSRSAYVWEGLDPQRIDIIAPAIDAFAPKNQALEPSSVASILAATGILREGSTGPVSITLKDGSSRSVERRSELFPPGSIPSGAALTVQVSRWDRLKDPLGVLQGFAQFVAPQTDAHLVLAGPGIDAVADDPEEAGVVNQVKEGWGQLPSDIRARVHLAMLPTEDAAENAIIVNALQRHAEVVTQKSLREGFGLTVAEAMWKEAPVVATRVGGIQDQIGDGRSGILIDDPRDLRAFGAAIVRLLSDRELARRLGSQARERVRRQFLAPRLLMQHARLTARLIEAERKGIAS